MPVHNRDVIGILAMELLDQLDEDIEDYEGEATINSAILVIDVTYPDGKSGIGFRSTDSRGWYQEALLNEAARVAVEEESQP